MTHAEWSVPKRAEVVLKMPVISKVFAELQAANEGRLLVRYPGGDEGTLWAHELRSWLVSLGVSARDIELRPGSAAANIIELMVQDRQAVLPTQKNISLN
ncbi:MAG: hypothetical protein OEZ39_17530 [Gammaproteobacteria bacterium]|nr:hypothetical protein [Gammaproteobacteria bacterium]MDH5653666.1 hypothetical protein [Gammaproteobacteria bacterium]